MGDVGTWDEFIPERFGRGKWGGKDSRAVIAGSVFPGRG